MPERDPISATHPIVGTWYLIAFTEEDIQSRALTYPFGKQARAIVIYTADGHVATIFAAADRKPPATAQASDQDAIGLYRSMIAFAGRYELIGDRLLYHPEISWNEAWNGTRQERLFQINGDHLEVRSMPTVSTLTGTETVFSLVWERAS
jgi:Lipocalin-like domain